MFLNNDLRIKSFTPEAVKVFSLIETDIGRPFTDIVSKLEYPDLLADIREVIRTPTQKEKTVRHLENRWYIIRIMPYRTMNHVIDGAVITLVDITDRKLMEERVEAALAYSRGIIETVREPLIVLDSGLKVISANKSFYRKFGVPSAETEGKVIYDLGNGQWNIPKLRELLEKILPESTEFSDYEVEHDFPGIGPRKMLLNARRITQAGAKTETILLAIEDVTGK
jgi:two-component system CheB/CheR fusion protein